MTGVPGDSTTTFYSIRLYWSGFDEDGTVVGYEWAITDSLPPPDEIPYRYTTRTDSVFVFTVDESREVLGHRFYLRAVDNEGKRDVTPAFTFFTVRNNCVPTTWFTRARAIGPLGEIRELTSTRPFVPTDTIPSGWSLEFAWTGADCDRAVQPDGTVITVGRVVGYDYKLVPLMGASVNTGPRDTTVSFAASGLRSDVYEMRVRAKDDAGLFGTDPALRTFVWNQDPVTRLNGEFFANIAGVGGEFARYVEGDTLPLTAAGVLLRTQITAFDPDPPAQVLALQARLVKDAAFWTDLGPDGIFQTTTAQYTGDYKLMARSLDAFDRWDGSPDTVVFFVNRSARFIPEWDYFGVLRTQRPLQDGVYAAGRDTLRLRFGAIDPDFVLAVQTSLELNYRFESYPLANGSQGQEVLLRPNWVGGENIISENPVGTPIQFVLTGSNAARLASGQSFLPGTYVLYVVVRERMGPDNQDRYGAREREMRIRFRLQ